MASIGYSRTQDHWEDLPSTATPADGRDLENWDQLGLMSNNTQVLLVWNGSTYVLPRYTPSGGISLSDTSRPRLFKGPTDPATLPGAVVTDNDDWDQVT